MLTYVLIVVDRVFHARDDRQSDNPEIAGEPRATDRRSPPPLLSSSVLHFPRSGPRSRRKAGRRAYVLAPRVHRIFLTLSLSLSLSLSLCLSLSFLRSFFTLVHPRRVVTRHFGRAPSDPQKRAPVTTMLAQIQVRPVVSRSYLRCAHPAALAFHHGPIF